MADFIKNSEKQAEEIEPVLSAGIHNRQGGRGK